MTECVICYEPYDTDARCPMVLDCGHSLCKECVTGLTSNRVRLPGPVKCPVCKAGIVKSGALEAKKNFALIEMIEKKSQMAEEQSSCHCSKSPVFYCRRCKKYLCKVCVDNHYGHPLIKFDPLTIVTKAKVDSVAVKLNKTADGLMARLERIEKAKSEASRASDDCKKKVRKFLNSIRSLVEDVEKKIEQEIEEGLSESIRQLERMSSAMRNQLESLTTLRDDFLEKTADVRKEEMIISSEGRVALENLAIKVEDELTPVVTSLPTQASLPVIRFKLDGPAIYHSRIYQAILDSCRVDITSVPLKLNAGGVQSAVMGDSRKYTF